jgi:hypothetical protein
MLNNSYKIVNEKIIKLKKFEFDFANLIELIKNYLVVQEIVVKNVYQIEQGVSNNIEVINFHIIINK